MLRDQPLRARGLLCRHPHANSNIDANPDRQRHGPNQLPTGLIVLVGVLAVLGVAVLVRRQIRHYLWSVCAVQFCNSSVPLTLLLPLSLKLLTFCDRLAAQPAEEPM